MSNDVTVLPDGSAFAVVSMPLPKDHWLYAPRGEWDNERDEYAECPRPILTNAQREAVRAAARYAIRGATMCGKETDFDPDALVLNMAYALCGPANGAILPADAAPASPQAPAQPEPVDNDPISDDEQTALYEFTKGTPHYAVVRKLYRAASASPQRAVEPLTPDEVADNPELTDMEVDFIDLMKIVRCVERAHGIGKQESK